MDTFSPTVEHIERSTNGSGQVAYSTIVQYPYEDNTVCVTFFGTAFNGAPVFMVMEDWDAIQVDDPHRFGSFVTEEWVFRFYSSPITVPKLDKEENEI